MNRFVDFLHQDGWHVIMVWEFNTSQVCSHCCFELQSGELPYKLCDVGSPVNGHAFHYKLSNSHFVKRCTRCWTLWNRDVNAALNIAYLGMLQYYRCQRPLCFRQGLERPPAYIRWQMARAAERAATALITETIVPVAPVAPVVANYVEAIEAETVDDAEAGKAREAASIAASPKHYIQRLAMACPAPDPETEWQKAYNKAMKGEEKRAAKKEVSKKSKVKVKRTADDLATAPDEPPSRKAKTAPKKTAPKRPTPKKAREEPEGSPRNQCPRNRTNY
ncbi:hypothetical protein IWW37_003741 [Coemansia sp. RSA 2050]|nr:hypothetical protein IWW37_003741 [Coemansia sp. RSA 2050]